MKQVSSEELLRRKNIHKAIEDFYGCRIPTDSFDRLAKALIRRKEDGLNEEELEALWYIQQNLNDDVYVKALAA